MPALQRSLRVMFAADQMQTVSAPVIDLVGSDSDREQESSKLVVVEKCLQGAGVQNGDRATSKRARLAQDEGVNKCEVEAPTSSRNSSRDPLLRLCSNPATARRVGGPERPVPDAELPNIAPVTVLRRPLPQGLADELLQQLLVESKAAWRSSSWVVHGQHHTTPRSSAVYTLSGHSMSSTSSSVSGGHVEQEERAQCAPSLELQEASRLLEELMAQMRPGARWQPNLALGNRYENGRECVGWHSDFLNALGPRPVIVGLSLGATRRFCVRRGGGDSSSSGGARADDGDAGLVVSIPMPHNTAVVMWDDCQEEWQHSVPRQADSTVGKHPVAGLVRLSLTFRMARPELGAHEKLCWCGRPSALKSKGGRYYLACSPMGASKQCGFWQLCPWAQAEAERLRLQVPPRPCSDFRMGNTVRG